MKKLVALLMMIVLAFSTCLVFTGCGDDSGNNGGNGGGYDNAGTTGTYYVPVAKFFYSMDKGHSYGDGTKEYAIGETVYMKLKAKVSTNKEMPETVKMKLTIPNITSVDAKYYDGQPITPVYDAIQNVTTYEFTITAALNAQEWEFVFQFIPNAEAEVVMLLEFDDKVESIYDQQNTVNFIKVTESSAGEYDDEILD